MMDANASDVTDGPPNGERGISPALDATLDLLSNRRRRYVLYHLRDADEAVALDELAERIASWEQETDGRDVGRSRGAKERVRADLYHSQVPRLAEAGVVTFDADERRVSLDDSVEMPIQEYLDLTAAEERVV
jgi:hypothetical protein